MILLVGTVSAADAHLFTNITDDVILNLSNEGNAYLTQSFFGGGDVSSPTYSFFSDINSGMFSILADKIGWGLGGVTKLTLDVTSLNVSSDLDICITSGNCLSAMSAGISPWVSTADYIYNTTASVGIGTDSPGALLDVEAVNNAEMRLTTSSGALGDNGTLTLLSYTDDAAYAQIKGTWSASGNGDMTFHTTTDAGATLPERMRITDDGKVGIGTVNPQQEFNVVGDANITGYVNATDFCLTTGACFSDTISFPGYTNIALINETNTFEENQIFSKNITMGDGIISWNGTALILKVT